MGEEKKYSEHNYQKLELRKNEIISSDTNISTIDYFFL